MKQLQVIKMALAFFLAMTIAQCFGLQYTASAGIVGLLTIQNTRKETFQICLKRVLFFFLAFICAYVVFLIFGYSAMSFAIFLFIFIGLSFLGHLEDGIAMNAVIATHYLIEESMNLFWIQNEFGIFMIGLLIGILINLYMPSQRTKIEQSLFELDQNIKELLVRMSTCLLKEQKQGSLFDEFENVLELVERMTKQTYAEVNNRLLNDTKYELQYLLMRKEQINVLKDIYDFIVRIDFVGNQALDMSDFINKMSFEYHENNDVEGLKEELSILKKHYQHDELPQTREEFENRAMLYTILCYLEKFLDLKSNFCGKGAYCMHSVS